MIEKHKQKSKKSATVSRPRQEGTRATLQDLSTGTKPVSPMDSSRGKNSRGRDQNVELVQVLQTALSSELIPATSNDDTMSSHSYDILDNCTLSIIETR